MNCQGNKGLSKGLFLVLVIIIFLSNIVAQVPAGNNTEIQFNNNSLFGADPKFVWKNGALAIGQNLNPSPGTIFFTNQTYTSPTYPLYMHQSLATAPISGAGNFRGYSFISTINGNPAYGSSATGGLYSNVFCDPESGTLTHCWAGAYRVYARGLLGSTMTEIGAAFYDATIQNHFGAVTNMYNLYLGSLNRTSGTGTIGTYSSIGVHAPSGTAGLINHVRGIRIDSGFFTGTNGTLSNIGLVLGNSCSSNGNFALCINGGKFRSNAGLDLTQTFSTIPSGITENPVLIGGIIPTGSLGSVNYLSINPIHNGTGPLGSMSGLNINSRNGATNSVVTTMNGIVLKLQNDGPGASANDMTYLRLQSLVNNSTGTITSTCGLCIDDLTPTQGIQTTVNAIKSIDPNASLILSGRTHIGNNLEPHQNSALQVSAGPNNNLVFTLPQMTTAQRLAINPPAGSLVYDTTENSLYVTTNIGWVKLGN